MSPKTSRVIMQTALQLPNPILMLCDLEARNYDTARRIIDDQMHAEFKSVTKHI